MNWVVISVIVILVWLCYPAEVKEHFPSSVYDLVWMHPKHPPPFEETLKWNIYGESLPDLPIGQEGAKPSDQQNCVRHQLQDEAQRLGYARRYCHGADATSDDEMKNCVTQGGAALPCLCKDYYRCIQKKGDKVKCQQNLSFRSCMADPNTDMVNC